VHGCRLRGVNGGGGSGPAWRHCSLFWLLAVLRLRWACVRHVSRVSPTRCAALHALQPGLAHCARSPVYITNGAGLHAAPHRFPFSMCDGRRAGRVPPGMPCRTPMSLCCNVSVQTRTGDATSTLSSFFALLSLLCDWGAPKTHPCECHCMAAVLRPLRINIRPCIANNRESC